MSTEERGLCDVGFMELYVPAEMSHGIRKAEDAGTDHGSDIVEDGVPPIAAP